MLLKVLLLLSVAVVGLIAQNLELVITNTVFPRRLYHIPTAYDGEDSVYLLGGYHGSGWVLDILKYSISTGFLENIGQMPNIYYGSTVWVGNGNLIYIGAVSNVDRNNKIWKSHSSLPNEWSVVGELPTKRTSTASVWDQVEFTYILGKRDSFNSSLSRYSSLTNEVVNIAEVGDLAEEPSAVWDSRTRSAYFFGGRNGSSSNFFNDILKFDSDSGTLTKLNITLPYPDVYTCAVWTGNEAYIIGGRGFLAEIPSIIRFNPATNEVTVVPVNNFPKFFFGTGCVFAEKLNRIYLFSGYSTDSFYERKIMYIDLDTTTPPTTTPTTTTPTTTTPTTTTPTTTTPTTTTTTATTPTTTTPTTTTPTTTTPTTTTPATTTPATTTPTTTTPTTITPTTTTPTTTSAETTLQTTTIQSGFDCPEREGLFPDPDNCRGFYNCDNFVPYHFCCPVILFYNDVTKRCDFYENVNCQNDPTLPCDSPPGE
jgi:hypothetical protein